MSYNTPAASTTNYGVVEIGSFIDVSNGVIALPQDVSTTANPTFASLTSTGAVTDSGNRVITSVTPTASTGVSITGLTSTGPAATWTITNTGVTSLTAGTGISLSGGTGAVTISASGTTTINTTLVTTAAYTALGTDDYIGVNHVGATTITLPTGITGKEYIVKDESGALLPAITITGTGGQLIDGAATASITLGFGSLSFVFRGTQWHIV